MTLGFNAAVNVKLGVATLQETVTVTGESPVVDPSATRAADQLRPAGARVAAECARHVVAARRDAVGRARTRRRRRQHGRHADDLLRLRLLRPEPSAHRRHQHDGGHVGGRVLSRLRLVRGGVHRRGRQLRGDAEPRRADAVRQQERRQPARRSNLYYDYENDDIQSQEPRPADQTIPSPGATIRPDGNRLASYKNFNLSVGGPLVPGQALGLLRLPESANSVAAPPSGSILDGTPFDTKLFNYTGKGTYQLNQNNRFVGYLQHGTKQQPNRTDSSNRLGAPVHILGDSTVLQDSPSWVYKGEWNGTIGQNMFAEFRAGQFGYNFGLDSNTDDDPLRIADARTRSSAADATGCCSAGATSTPAR